MKYPILFVLLLMIAVTVAGCGSAPTASAAKPSPEPTTEPATEPVTVQDQASLVAALEAAGATVEVGDSIEQAFFSPVGQIIKVNGKDVQVFEYESPEAMENEASQVAPDGGSIGTNMVMWVETPHFFKSGRVLVLYVGDDTAVLDLLQGVMGEQFAGR